MDIVKRLRVQWSAMGDMANAERLEAADEIERLREDISVLEVYKKEMTEVIIARNDEIERLRKQVSDLHELVVLATEIKPVYRRFEEKWADIYVPRKGA